MRKRNKIGRRLTCLISIFIVLFLVWITTPLKRVMVVGNSMYPTYLSNTIVTTDTSQHHLEKNDVGIFRENSGELIIKRVVAVAGETVYERQIDNNLWFYVDQDEYRDVIFYNTVIVGRHPALHVRYGLRAVKVPPGEVYICGDNHNQTICGLRLESQVYGKVLQ